MCCHWVARVEENDHPAGLTAFRRGMERVYPRPMTRGRTPGEERFGDLDPRYPDFVYPGTIRESQNDR